MEIVIVLCLVIVIVLLLDEKRAVKKQTRKEEFKKDTPVHLPDIMGKPKSVRSLLVPKIANENQTSREVHPTGSFDTDKKKEIFDDEIPQEEPDEDFNSEPDYLGEELLYREREPIDGAGYASGVTFEELAAVEMLFEQEKPEPSLQKRATAIVHKLQGTELFSLLENSIEGASKKIAELLDKGLSTETDSGSSMMRKNDIESFDIGKFV